MAEAEEGAGGERRERRGKCLDMCFMNTRGFAGSAD